MSNLIKRNNGEQVRFSRNPRKPRKNTLFTVLKDKHIYFGISKWNSKVDSYSREEGIKFAKERAYSAMSMPVGMFISANGMMGKCPVKDLGFVLQHFRRQR